MDDSNLVKDTEGRGQGQGQETQDNEVTTSRRLENRLPQESGAFRNRQYTDAPSRIPPDQDSSTRSRTDPDWDNDDDDDGGHAGTNSPFDDHPKVVPRNNKSAEAGKSVSILLFDTLGGQWSTSLFRSLSGPQHCKNSKKVGLYNSIDYSDTGSYD